MEYYCCLCKDWEEPEYVEGHFESVHNQKKVTIESLQERWSNIGCWDTREIPVVEEKEEKKPKSWMYRDDHNPDEPIVTNNFRHDT